MVPKARSSAVTIKKVMIGRDSDGHAYTLEELREFLEFFTFAIHLLDGEDLCDWMSRHRVADVIESMQ